MALGATDRSFDWLDAYKRPKIGQMAVREAQSMGGRLGAMLSPGYNPENYGPLEPDGLTPGRKVRKPSAVRGAASQMTRPG